jgi:hypothetical protein
MILDKKIPKNGLTFDNTPKIVVRLNRPLPPGYVVMILRNGIDVGLATKINDDYVYTDDVQLDGIASYKAEVQGLVGAPQVSNEWPINIQFG